MKRFWLFALMVAGSLAVLTAPAIAKNAEGEDTSDAIEEVNSGLGSLSQRVGDLEKILGLKFFGDVRVRYAVWSQTQSNIAAAPAPKTISDKAVGRYRARFGVKEQFGDMLGGLRIATGGNTNPNSQNNTFANGFADPTINVDQAFLTYEPHLLEKHLKVTVGKMANPLLFTPLTWDPDINPEGALVEFSKVDTKFRATYFDLVNTAGTAQTPTNSQTARDEFMANFQLEQLFRINSDSNIDLTLGYEYIPNVSALAGGNLPGVGPTIAISTTNKPVGVGNIWDYGKVIPDFQVGEAILVVNHKIGDIPMKWTAHFIDNLNSFKVPHGENLATGPTAAKTTGYTTLSNELGAYVEAKLGDTKKDHMLGCLAISYVEPNAQLANLASDDANFTNTQYLFEQVGYGLEDNVTFLLSAWEIQRIYYAYYGAANNNQITGTGNSRDPLFQIYGDCVVSF